MEKEGIRITFLNMSFVERRVEQKASPQSQWARGKKGRRPDEERVRGGGGEFGKEADSCPRLRKLGDPRLNGGQGT